MKKRHIFVALFVTLLFAFAVANGEQAYQYAQVKTQQGPLNMRETASSKADILEKIPNGEMITVTSIGDTWAACLYNGQSGYVMVKYLTLMEESQLRTLSRGDAGEDVLQCKERLRELFYLDAGGKLSDTFDADTEAAVRQFQAAQGMEETGVFTPQAQTLLLWGPAKDNRPTAQMKLKITCDCTANNHVGGSWSKYFSINSHSVSSGDTVALILGESITVYAKITEQDKSPDVGSAKDVREITQEDLDNGFTLTQKVTVREDKGQYAGKKAYWTVTYSFSP